MSKSVFAICTNCGESLQKWGKTEGYTTGFFGYGTNGMTCPVPCIPNFTYAFVPVLGGTLKSGAVEINVSHRNKPVSFMVVADGVLEPRVYMQVGDDAHYAIYSRHKETVRRGCIEFFKMNQP